MAGRTQEWLAERVNVSLGTVKAWELDIRDPKREQIKTIAIALNATQELPIEWVMQDPKEKNTVFKIGQFTLSESTIRFIKEFNDVTKMIDELVTIACDNELSPEESDKFANILKEIDELIGAAYSLKYVKQTIGNNYGK